MTRALAAIIAASVFSSLYAGLVGPVYPIFILERFAGTITDVGLLYTSFYLASAILKVFTGRLVDRIGKVPIFLLGGAIGTVCTLAYTLNLNITQLYLLEIFNGLAFALQRPAFLVLLTDATIPQKRGSQMGLFDSAEDLAGAISSLVAVLIVASFGFQFLFYLCSGFQATSGLIVLTSHRRL